MPPKEEGEERLGFLGEVRKVGQAESLNTRTVGEGETQKASHQFLIPVSCLCYSVAFSRTEPPMLAAYVSALLGKLPPDWAPMLDAYISALLDTANREITLFVWNTNWDTQSGLALALLVVLICEKKEIHPTAEMYSCISVWWDTHHLEKRAIYFRQMIMYLKSNYCVDEQCLSHSHINWEVLIPKWQ